MSLLAAAGTAVVVSDQSPFSVQATREETSNSSATATAMICARCFFMLKIPTFLFSRVKRLSGLLSAVLMPLQPAFRHLSN